MQSIHQNGIKWPSYIIYAGRDISYKHDHSLTFLTFVVATYKWLEHDFNLTSSTFPICFPGTRTMAPAWPRRGLARLVLVCGAPSEPSEFLRSRILHADCRSISHRIHGTGIFTYIYLKNSTVHAGKYTVRPMDPMGFCLFFFSTEKNYWIQTINFDLRKSWSVRFTVFCGAPLVLA